MHVSAVRVNAALQALNAKKETDDVRALSGAAAEPAGAVRAEPDVFTPSHAAAEPNQPAALISLKTDIGPVAPLQSSAASAAPAQNQQSGGAATAEPIPIVDTPVTPRLFNTKDREALLASWGAREGDARFASEYDLDGDGVIGSNDLARLLGAFDSSAPAAAVEDEGSEGSNTTTAPSPELAPFYEAWGAKSGEAGYDPARDLNGDGVVNASDVALFLGSRNAAAGPAKPVEPVTDPSAVEPGLTLGDRLKALYAAWGARSGDQGFNGAYDFDGDGVITASDLAHLLGRESGSA